MTVIGQVLLGTAVVSTVTGALLLTLAETGREVLRALHRQRVRGLSRLRRHLTTPALCLGCGDTPPLWRMRWNTDDGRFRCRRCIETEEEQCQTSTTPMRRSRPWPSRRAR